MKEYCVLSDIHWGHKSFSKKIFLNDLMYFERSVFPTILDRDIKDVIFCGDMIHNRDLTSNYILQVSKEKFFKWFDDNGVILHLLVGNHDCLFKNRIDFNFPRTNLKEFSNIIVYDQISVKQIGNLKFGFLPWQTSSIIPENEIDPKEVDILVAHFDMINAEMQTGVKSKVGFSLKDFKDYKQVLTGHYHNSSDIQNVKYVGSPYQMSYSDYGSKKGFWIMNDNLEFEFIENTINPRYLKLFYIETHDGDIKLYLGGVSNDKVEISVDEAIELLSKNYFKFIVKTFKSQKLLQSVFKKLTEEAYDKIDMINEVSSIEDFDISKFEEDIEENIEIIDIIEDYVDKSKFRNDKLSKVKLKKLVRGYYEKTKMGDNE